MNIPGSKLEREHMVEQQIRGRGIRDPAILAAMREVPREMFVPEEFKASAYEDTPLPIPAGQTISQPYVVAVMIRALRLKPGERVLEIGTGSGYAAAVLSRIVGEVHTVERHQVLVEFAEQRFKQLGYNNVHVLYGDGTLGWPEHAPYDAIMVSAGGPEVPSALRQQLAIGGRLVMPIGPQPKSQHLVRIVRKSEREYVMERLGRVRFVPLIGEQGWED